jgi:hypothetical protein
MTCTESLCNSFGLEVKTTDDKALRDMFYSMSEKSIAFRFFQPIKEFTGAGAGDRSEI